MAIITCPECKKKISESATSCPKCGYHLTPAMASEIKKKEQKAKQGCGIGCLFIIVIFIIIGSCSSESTKETTLKPKKETRKKQAVYSKTNGRKQELSKTKIKPQTEFPFSVNKFISRYNQSCKTLGNNIIATLDKSTDNGEFLIVQVKTNRKYLVLILTANNKTQAVQSIVFIGSGDGTMQSGVDILFGPPTVVMAIENPTMPIHKRPKILDDLGLLNEKLSTQRKINIERNGVKYSISLSKAIGTMLTAEPI